MNIKHHTTRSAQDLSVDQLIAMGNNLWIWNSRSHGDDEDDLFFVEGRLARHKPEDGDEQIIFVFKTPMGQAIHEFEDEAEVFYRVVNFIEFEN